MNRFEETYAGILAARPAGRKTYAPVEPAAYRDRLRAALLARLAGCTLGAPVEGWSIEQMEKYAAELKLPFPWEVSHHLDDAALRGAAYYALRTREECTEVLPKISL